MKNKKSEDPYDATIRVPFVRPNITNEDKKSILEALKGSFLTDGPILRKFEYKFAKFTDARYAIGVSNATAALHLSLNALGIGEGDEVIIPDITFVATANAVLFTRATPVIADVNEDMTISIDSIKKSITKKTRAIIPVHFSGKPSKMYQIISIAKKNNLSIIEDCAHAIGSRINNIHVGTFGDVGCFSFYPTKNLTTFEGGMIITNSKKISDYVRTARNHGITKSLQHRLTKGKPWEYDIVTPGYNYRLDEIRAAIGISQLKRINKINSQRRKACLYYNSKLVNKNGVSTPKYLKNEDHGYHLYVIRIQDTNDLSRDKIFKKLQKNGIRTSVHYKPLHEFSAYKKRAKIIDDLKNSRQIYKEILSLPLYPQITRKEQDLIINNFEK